MNRRAQLGKIANIVRNEIGLNFENNRLDDLERGIITALDEIKIENKSEFIENLSVASSIEPFFLKVLSSHLTVGETYFFRESPAMNFFVKKMMPEVINKAKQDNRAIKIWCAGCSSGEEAYSLAILINEHFPELPRSSFSILATDISSKAINKAISGKYTEWSFRETPGNIKNKYFEQKDGFWNISPGIKRLVNFSYLNLAKESFSSQIASTNNIDIIFCRNVLMYLAPDKIKKAAENFYNSLTNDGWFVTSQVELNDEYFSLFEKVYFENGIFYQKNVEKKKTKSLPYKNYLEQVLAKTNSGNIKSQRRASKNIDREVKSVYFSNTLEVEVPLNSVSETDIDELYNSGRYSDCIKLCISEMAKNEKNHKHLTILAKSYANTGHYKEAISVIDKIITEGLSDEDIFYLYGTILHELNEIGKAKEVFKKGLYINPDHLFSHLMMGNILNQEGKKSAANKHYSNVLKILEKWNSDEIVSGSGGLTKARLKNMVENLLSDK
ncbi:MAG: hypothetical protein ACD_77C00498G0002 [uncultured bacterium]|nr:MAG: hypothetical protein ACD_77C00498G0002 [uncultured bacterium]